MTSLDKIISIVGQDMLKRIAIGRLRPNPFRRLEDYPIRREKVDRLKTSIDSTGFWGTIVGRPVDGGTIEIAFGHHRLVALHEMFGDDHIVEMIVRDLSNELMLRMMAAENLEEWGSSAWVELETIRATLDAADKGLITLPPAAERGPRSETERGRVQYSRVTVAAFLGWTKAGGEHRGGVQPNRACQIAFQALDLIEQGLVSEREMKELTREQMRELCAATMKVHQAEARAAENQRDNAAIARKNAEAAANAAERARLESQARMHETQAAQHDRASKSKPKQFASDQAGRYREGAELLDARKRALEVSPTVERAATVADVNAHAARAIEALDRILSTADGLTGRLDVVRHWRRELSEARRGALIEAAEALRRRIDGWIDVFKSGPEGHSNGRQSPCRSPSERASSSPRSLTSPSKS